MPHWPSVGDTQLRPLQQPLAHEVASQTHSPFWQRWPASHAGPVPQPHAPETQLSVVGERQSTQTAPPMPQAEVAGAWQTPLKQHPWGQFWASQPVQAPLEQSPWPHV